MSRTGVRVLLVGIVCVLLLPLAFAASGVAQPRYPPESPAPTVLPTIITTASPEETEAPPEVLGRPPEEGLPVTGGDVILFLLIAAGSVGIGTMLVRRSRKTSDD